MKNILTFSLFLFTFCFSLAAFAAYDDIKPGARTDKVLNSVEWENTNDVVLAESTAEGVLSAFVADEASARALLAQVKGAYRTDPLVLCQVAAVSQWVMSPEPCWICFWKPSPAEGRKVWVKTLLRTAEGSRDTYVKMACLDQLRWCGCDCPCVLKRIRAVGAQGDKPVKDFSEMVVRELTGKSIGL